MMCFGCENEFEESLYGKCCSQECYDKVIAEAIIIEYEGDIEEDSDYTEEHF